MVLIAYLDDNLPNQRSVEKYAQQFAECTCTATGNYAKVLQVGPLAPKNTSPGLMARRTVPAPMHSDMVVAMVVATRPFRQRNLIGQCRQALAASCPCLLPCARAVHAHAGPPPQQRRAGARRSE